MRGVVFGCFACLPQCLAMTGVATEVLHEELGKCSKALKCFSETPGDSMMQQLQNTFLDTALPGFNPETRIWKRGFPSIMEEFGGCVERYPYDGPVLKNAAEGIDGGVEDQYKDIVCRRSSKSGVRGFLRKMGNPWTNCECTAEDAVYYQEGKKLPRTSTLDTCYGKMSNGKVGALLACPPKRALYSKDNDYTRIS